MLTIEYSGQFLDQYAHLISEQKTSKELVAQVVKRFRKNASDTRLDNHHLHKRMKDKWAFSVTSDIRIVYEWLEKTTVRFLAIGEHTDVYGKKRV